MAVTTLTNIIDASRDQDLLARIGAAAAQAGIPEPLMWAQRHAAEIASQSINADGETIASVYAYAAATYVPPGLNPAAVTDDYIRQAVAQVNTPAT